MIKNHPFSNFLSIIVEKSMFFTVGIYLILVAVMEVVNLYGNVIYGSLGNAVLIFVAINHAAWANKTLLQRVLPAVALLPFLRLLSVVLPVPGWPSQVAYILVALPLLAAISIILYNNGITLAAIGLQCSSWKTQLPIAFTGLPLGFIGYLILRPQPLFLSTGPLMWAVNLIIILFFIAFTEEVLFRGILFRVLSEINGQFASVSLAILYACLHFGSKSPIYAIYMGLVGWLFTRFASQTGSIWGIVVANFLLVAGMGLFWPMLLA